MSNDRDPAAPGREAFARQAWNDAFQALRRADHAAALTPDDLERLAMAAYLTRRDNEFHEALERAHRGFLDAGLAARAARCAFWISLGLMLRGDVGPANGWLTRGRRVLDEAELDAVERGYLLLPEAELHLHSGDHETAAEMADRAAAEGRRFRDADLTAAARHLQGRVLIRADRVPAGLALLDEAMVAVTAGELSPIMTGLIYCSVIDTCQEVLALARAREWTDALSRWCDTQQQLVAFTATCLVHRAAIKQLHGAWPDALAEAERACARARPPAAAYYQLAEVHRLRGAFAAAESAYRNANRAGLEPQPGLALLRLAQGRERAAAAAIRRVLQAAADPVRRVRLLPAYVEIMLATGDAAAAREACRELVDLATRLASDMVRAMAADAGGAVALSDGNAHVALESLREAWRAWRDLGAPYQAARARELMGSACHALGDHDGANLEWDAARDAFARLGAAPDLARLTARTGARTERPHGLTPRELQVLRHVAAGKTNRAIAGTLGISEKTVARHVSNIFTKLGLSSRTAATAYAYEHGLR